MRVGYSIFCDLLFLSNNLGTIVGQLVRTPPPPPPQQKVSRHITDCIDDNKRAETLPKVIPRCSLDFRALAYNAERTTKSYLSPASTTYESDSASRQKRIVRVLLRRKSNRKNDNTIIGKSSRTNINDNPDKKCNQLGTCKGDNINKDFFMSLGE